MIRWVSLVSRVLAAFAIGLVASPGGFLSVPLSGQGVAPLSPLRLAVPLFAVGIVVGARSRRGWSIAASGVVVAALATGGARWSTGDTHWMSVYGYDDKWFWLCAFVAGALGVSVGGLAAAIRSSAMPAVLASAFVVGLVSRTGANWYEARYDAVAAVLAVVAVGVGVWFSGDGGALDTATHRDAPAKLGTLDTPTHRDAPTQQGVLDTPTHRGAAGVLALATSLVAFILIFGLAYAFRTELQSIFGSDGEFVVAERVFVGLAAITTALVAFLAVRARRSGLGAGRHVLVGAALATGLGVRPNAGGTVPSLTLIAVSAIAVVAAWLVPPSRPGRPTLPLAELGGLALVSLGMIVTLASPHVAPSPRATDTIAVGLILAATSAVRGRLTDRSGAIGGSPAEPAVSPAGLVVSPADPAVSPAGLVVSPAGPAVSPVESPATSTITADAPPTAVALTTPTTGLPLATFAVTVLAVTAVTTTFTASALWYAGDALAPNLAKPTPFVPVMWALLLLPLVAAIIRTVARITRERRVSDSVG